ncbi:MAG: RHS repeat-associated core domain-containing protein [Chthonomonadaceae bacterium]|nr:RHS repeat-associated core domain-containing protein [Chthonomonadaceae bacterium]
MTARISSSAGTRSFLYDNCGRTTEEKWDGATVKTYAWNHDDRLVSATGPWGTRSYGYNGLGSRVSETGGASRSWLRRGAGPTSAVLKDSVNRYSAGRTFRSLAGGTSTFMGGGHKSVDALLSSSQTLTGTVRRDAFGLAKEQAGTWNQPFGFGGNFGYQTDDDTGLELLGNRYYDASIGRFLSRDPIKDGPNWYVYCLNDPVDQCDPDGRTWIKVIQGVGKYVVFPTNKHLKRFARKIVKEPEFRVDKGHKGGPPHFHIVNDELNEAIKNLHLTTKAYADEAAENGVKEWVNWEESAIKKSGKGIWGGLCALALSIVTRDPVGAGEAVADTLEGPVNGFAVKYRYRKYYRHLEDEPIYCSD